MHNVSVVTPHKHCRGLLEAQSESAERAVVGGLNGGCDDNERCGRRGKVVVCGA